MRKYRLFLSIVPIVCLALSCTAAKEEKPPVDYILDATIKDIMDSMVDPSATYIWDSSGIEISAAGELDKFPKNPEEWKEMRRKAVLLVEAGNLLIMPGRKVARPGEKSENPGIELGPDEIQTLIDKDRATFITLAKEFQATAIRQLRAIEDKDREPMIKAGGEIDMNCENCHKKYWYPNDPAFKQEAEQKK
jgi:hypothetical protein